MFENFAEEKAAGGERRRWALSVGLGLFTYGGLVAGAMLLGGAAPAQEPKEEPLEVIFAPPPPPPPPPPPVEPEPAARKPPPAAPLVSAPKHIKRKAPPPDFKPRELKAPTEISEEKPEEKDASEFAVVAAAPGEGDAAGREGGTGMPGVQVASVAPEAKPTRKVRRRPVQLTEDIAPPQMLPSSGAPEFPQEMKAAGKNAMVILKVVIEEDGRIRRVQVMRGEEPFVSSAIRWAKSSRWKPAVGRGGEKLPVFKILQIPFRLRM